MSGALVVDVELGGYTSVGAAGQLRENGLPVAGHGCGSPAALMARTFQ